MLEGNEHEGSKENEGVALPIDEHSNGNGTFLGKKYIYRWQMVHCDCRMGIKKIIQSIPQNWEVFLWVLLGRSLPPKHILVCVAARTIKALVLSVARIAEPKLLKTIGRPRCDNAS